MRFKSGKFWSAISFSLGLGALVCPLPTFATIVVAPQPGFAVGNFQPIPQVYPAVSSTSVYYPAINSAEGITLPATSLQDPGGTNTVLDFGKYQYTANNFIVVDVTPFITAFNNISSGGTPILVITMPATTPGNPTPTTDPVIAQNPSDPSGTSCLSPNGCYDQVLVSSPARGSSPAVSQYYYRAFNIQPNQTLELALDMTAICDSTSQTGAGCQSLITPPTSGGVGYTTLQLTFGVYIVPPSEPLNTIPLWNSSLAQGDTPVTVSFNFSNAPASGNLTCTMGSAYYPGDAQITVDGSQFLYTLSQAPADSLAAVDIVYSQTTSATPPAITPIVPSAANVAAGTSGTYTLQEQSVITLPGQSIGGFVNSTQADPVYYALGFIGRDQYGFLIPGSPPSSCAYSTAVQTASIGSLLQASKCFIATATFRSMDSPPLVLLRAFRDRFLEHFGLGRAFVHWYYAWSPGAADWLVANPVFRFPIFLALIPLQVLAWLVLHPIEFLLLSMLAFFVLGYGLVSRRKELHG